MQALLRTTYVSQVAIVDKLHDQEHIEENLALRVPGNLSGSLSCAVKFVLDSLTSFQFGGLARQLKALVKIWKVELEDQDGVCKIVCLAQFFELFG